MDSKYSKVSGGGLLATDGPTWRAGCSVGATVRHSSCHRFSVISVVWSPYHLSCFVDISARFFHRKA